MFVVCPCSAIPNRSTFTRTQVRKQPEEARQCETGQTASLESRGRDDDPATHRHYAVDLARHAIYVGAGVRVSSWRSFVAKAQEHFQGARQKVSRNIYSLARHSVSLCPACATDTLWWAMIQVMRILSGRPYGPCSDGKQTALQVAGSDGTRKTQGTEVCAVHC